MTAAQRRLFGTDGVRGIANADLTPELALGLGRALGTWIGEQGYPREVLLARDTRLSGPLLTAAVSAGVASTGVNVRDCGVLPTPGLCLLAAEAEAGGGVVLSASHNAPTFNGVKIVGPGGKKLAVSVERYLEELTLAEEDLGPRPTGEGVGRIEAWDMAGEAYLEVLWRRLGGEFSLRGQRVVLDCAHGAAAGLAERAFARAGAEVVGLHCAALGELINVGCGSLHPEGVGAAVREQEAQVGVAFDGDADRAICVDERGAVRDGDFMLYVLAADLQARGELAPAVVAGTVMANLGVELALRELGVELLRAGVGDRYVVEGMAQSGARLGGEQSGHLVFGELGVGDGLYTALRVCEVLARSGRSFSELCAPVRKVPQTLVNVPVRDRHAWERSAALQERLGEWEARLGHSGRVLVRASGTEPLVRVMVEALDHDLALSAAEDLAELLRRDYGFTERAEEEE